MGKKVWILTQYAAPPQYETRIRNNAMAKYLMHAGYDVTIFGSSLIHNSDINLISDNSLFIRKQYEDLKYIHINAPSYSGNGLKRKLNMFIYPRNLKKVIKQLDEKPDIIINDLGATSFNVPFRIAKNVKAPIITEVRDLWPESMVVYGYLKRTSMLAKILYYFEKNMYKKSDAIVYTMEGWPDYIKERGWDQEVFLEKSFYINNGLDLEVFNDNKNKYQIYDSDLNDSKHFKVIYTGSIRRVNGLGKLLDVAKLLQDSRVKFLIWGNGDELPLLQNRVQTENIDNVVFKGVVDKKYIPFIVSKADLNIAHNTATEMFRFGISFNKIFDYLAACKPILCDFPCSYNPVVQSGSGISVDSGEVGEIADCIRRISCMDEETYRAFCKNAEQAVEEYDYKNLTNKIIRIFNIVNK